MSDRIGGANTQVWKRDGRVVTDEELAVFTLRHAHEFYDAVTVFTVEDNGGEVPGGGIDSICREWAFATARDVLGLPYDTFYYAWLNEEPIRLTAESSTAAT